MEVASELARLARRAEQDEAALTAEHAALSASVADLSRRLETSTRQTAQQSPRARSLHLSDSFHKDLHDHIRETSKLDFFSVLNKKQAELDLAERRELRAEYCRHAELQLRLDREKARSRDALQALVSRTRGARARIKTPDSSSSSSKIAKDLFFSNQNTHTRISRTTRSLFLFTAGVGKYTHNHAGRDARDECARPGRRAVRGPRARARDETRPAPERRRRARTRLLIGERAIRERPLARPTSLKALQPGAAAAPDATTGLPPTSRRAARRPPRDLPSLLLLHAQITSPHRRPDLRLQLRRLVKRLHFYLKQKWFKNTIYINNIVIDSH